MKFLTATLFVLLASPAAWANGSDQSGGDLTTIIAAFGGTVLQPRSGGGPVQGLQQSGTTHFSGGGLSFGDSEGLPRREIGRNFTAARATGRGISVKPMAQQMNVQNMFRGR